jgi:hypothetical protein
MPDLINAHFDSQVSLMAGSIPSRPRLNEIDAAVAATARQAARLEPYWRVMHQRAETTDVGFTRWVGNGQ